MGGAGWNKWWWVTPLGVLFLVVVFFFFCFKVWKSLGINSWLKQAAVSYFPWMLFFFIIIIIITRSGCSSTNSWLKKKGFLSPLGCFVFKLKFLVTMVSIVVEWEVNIRLTTIFIYCKLDYVFHLRLSYKVVEKLRW